MGLDVLVGRNARTAPEKEGLIFEDRRYTWKEQILAGASDTLSINQYVFVSGDFR